MATAATSPIEITMSSYTAPIYVSLSKATLLASLVTGSVAAPSLTPADLTACAYEFGSITTSSELIGDGSSISIMESIVDDLPAGQSFTHADAAAIGIRLAQRTSALQSEELELGSDL